MKERARWRVSDETVPWDRRIFDELAAVAEKYREYDTSTNPQGLDSQDLHCIVYKHQNPSPWMIYTLHPEDD
jgi:hypothetical protein